MLPDLVDDPIYTSQICSLFGSHERADLAMREPLFEIACYVSGNTQLWNVCSLIFLVPTNPPCVVVLDVLAQPSKLALNLRGCFARPSEFQNGALISPFESRQVRYWPCHGVTELRCQRASFPKTSEPHVMQFTSGPSSGLDGSHRAAPCCCYR
jgi:hypothetical protein